METNSKAAGLVAPSPTKACRPGFGWLCGWRGGLAVGMVLLIAAGALDFRLQQLEHRPFHLDEGVQAVKAGELFDSGHYRYDPLEFHGPSLYYFTLPILKLSGAKNFAETRDADFRLVPVLCGVGLILLLLLLRRGLGGVATLTAAGLLAVSPAMVFFSRYYIQEMMLVMFAALALGALWRFDRSRRAGLAALLGLAVGLMYATKETSVIYCGAMSAAYGWLILRRRSRAGLPLWKLHRRQGFMLLLAGGVAALVAGLFYSSFLAHPRGPVDSLLAFLHYFERTGGDGSAAMHRQPWYYYLKMLAFTKDAPGPWWSEGLILVLAVVGLGTSLWGRVPRNNQPGTVRTSLAKNGSGQNRSEETQLTALKSLGHARATGGPGVHPDLALLLAIYTLCMTVAYALIPYKTPWNLLGFLHGLILMAGIGAAAIFHGMPWRSGRAAWILLLLAATWQLAAQAARANFRFCADPRNPYVYAHSVPDVVRLARRIDEIAALHPDGRSMQVHFITPDYWPMPYYLRKFKRVGYWSEIPTAPDAPVMIVGADLQERLDPLLRDPYHTAYYGLRPDVLLLLNIRQDLWERYLQIKKDSTDKDLRNPK
ncbi:MAG: TIGR03663 family protein [Akkermansiaceae bacterium]|nr:TIGR03663 family protein [Akkermansiaceae bacterium]